MLVRFLFNRSGRQNLTPFHCDFCAERFADPQELVDHLWEEHRYPAEVRVNGRVFRSLPSQSSILDRYFAYNSGLVPSLTLSATLCPLHGGFFLSYHK